MGRKEEKANETDMQIDNRKDQYGLEKDESLLSVKFATTDNQYLTEPDED
ncbi:hypothetical protein [Bacillus sp. FJAT-27225]|nr:hypothetical protein [Bacillus sp. FJAT-27225]